MPVYQIHRLRESQRQQFRWAPHTSGITVAKPRDYDRNGEIEADSPYAAWMALRGGAETLRVGDILEAPSGDLRIYKYVGFEEARWFVPEPAPAPATAGPAAEVT